MNRSGARRRVGAAVLLAAGGIAAGALQAAEAAPAAQTLDQALVSGKPVLALRGRIEDVSEDAFASDAVASTLRLRLGYESAPWKHWTAGAEIDHVAILGGDAFNSTRNGRSNRPLITDPDGTDLNQAFIRYAGATGEVVLGRQRLVLDNQRFIGGVAWRQNEQTFDAITLRSKRFKKLSLGYSYADNVNRIFGPDSGTPPSDLRSSLHAANAALDLGKGGKLSVFHYSMDFRNAAALSNASTGALWTGKLALAKSGWSMPWSVSYATQDDAGANPTDYTAHYSQIELGLARDRFGIRLGQELLSGDATRPERRFQTPLATLHIYQGWADKFLTTPPQGIEDRYVAANYKHQALEIQLAWHDFQAQAVSRSYGTEVDASVSYRLFGNTDLLAKIARYDADGLATDTTKLWLQLAREFRPK